MNQVTPETVSAIGSRLLRRGALVMSVAAVLLLLTSSAVAASLGVPSAPGTARALAPTSVAHSSTTGAAAPVASAGGAPISSSSSGLGSPVGAQPHPAVTGLPSSGRATFFNNTVFPSIPVANQSCVSGTYLHPCFNSTSEPSINLTTNGVLAVAYTAYTNMTDCPQFFGNGNGTTEVAVRTSTDLGATWNAPVYLDNPVCTGYGGNFSSAAQPSITSLSNGTLVMAYEEYNISCGSYCYYPYVAPYYYYYYEKYDRIVATESYDNGTTWTTPQVLSTKNDTGGSSSSVPNYPSLMPRIAASGSYVYVAWTNYTYPFVCDMQAGVKLAVSSNGGSTWSAPTVISPEIGTGQYCYTKTWVAANPDLVVVPNGTLYVSYVTQIAYGCNYFCEGAGSVVVARSTNHGSTFAIATVQSGLQFLYDWCCDNSIFLPTNPSIAYGNSTNQLFVTWSSEFRGSFCETYTATSSYCGTNQVLTLWIANSSDGGVSWTAHQISTPAINPNNGPYNQLYMPSIAVTEDGTLHLQAAYENDSICGGTYGYCGADQEIYMNSTDNGTTWSNMVLVWANFTENYPYNLHPGWPGEYTSMQPVGDSILLAWTFTTCNTGFCDWQFGTPGTTGVVVSELYTGPGITITFSETGLKNGVSWSAEVMGNWRATTAPGSVSVSGVPPGQYIAYSVPWVNQSWGVAYTPSFTPASPASFSANSTVPVTFSELVKFTFQTTPALGPDQWLYGYANYALSPAPGSYWVTVGTSESITVTPQAPLYCYPCANLTFSSWTGAGPGNYTGLSPNITVTLGGPVNETANFALNGWCYTVFASGNVCMNNTYYPMDFVESGLPSGVDWGVTVIESNGTTMTNDTSSNLNGFLVPETPSTFYVWTVPDPTTGDYWVPTTDVQSPTSPPSSALIHVTFTKESVSLGSFSTIFAEQGLPSGTSWSLELNSKAYGIENGGNYTATLSGGGSYTVNGSAVYLETGYGYYVSSVRETSYVMNSTAQSLSPGGSISVNGSSVVTLVFSPLYLLTTTASTGGTVTPATGWIAAGAVVSLNATALPNYHFVSWTGSGSGATTTSQSGTYNPTITPKGPVTEFATFRPNLPPTWNVTITGTGLPSGTPLVVSIGGTEYSGSGSFRVGDIVDGTYAIAVPYVYLNATDTTRFVPTDVTSSLTFAPGGGLEITANGTLTISFETQYLILLASTPAAGGTISPAPGSYWTNASESVALTASSASGYRFVGWNASNSNGVVSASSAVTLTALGPVVETAQFGLRPILPPQTYWVSVSEQGLPSGVSWNLSFGPYGASGSTGTLTVNNLNGSYLVQVPVVYVAAGERFVSNVTNVSVQVTSNSTTLLSVAFSEEYLVSVSASAGGDVTPSSTWAAAGGSVPLTATPATGYMFANWSGSGAGSYSGTVASSTVTANGPITETATFVPIYKTSTQTQTTNAGMPLALGLLVGLLVVGLVVGLLVGRMRRRRTGGTTVPPPETSYAEPAPPSEESPPS
ncbi:MAG TPA: hypothetical protein VFG07_02435 [Thermoplasmata archaeon]|nr:hypothetical protein [Thermoplasmata archaeon]